MVREKILWNCPVTFFNISYFVFNRRKKLIQVWNNLSRLFYEKYFILRRIIPFYTGQMYTLKSFNETFEIHKIN